MSEHPSAFIAEELDARGWSVGDLLARMNDSERNVHAVALDFYFSVGPSEPGLRIGDHMAAQLAHAFGVSERFFLNLEQAWLSSLDSEPE